MPAYKPDQRNVVSSAGELKQLTQKTASPDGIFSGSLQRIKMVDGEYVPGGIARNAGKIGSKALNHTPLPKRPPRP